MNNSEPNIVVFVCNWDGLSCVESAAQSGLTYPSSVKVVRASCLSRIHPGLILKAFEVGADGVVLLGCTSGNCRFYTDFACIEHNYDKARSVLKLLGLEEKRLSLIQLPHDDGYAFVEHIMRVIRDIQHIQTAAHTRV